MPRTRDYDDAQGGPNNSGAQHLMATSIFQQSSQEASSDPSTLIRTKDGKPCRTCHDFRSWAKMLGDPKGKQNDVDNFRPSTDQLELIRRDAKQCPVDKDELGQSSWRLLHTMSVQYPDQPSEKEQGDMKEFVGLFARLYPCEPCAEDFQKDISNFPPTVTSGKEFATWVCQAHNRVNTKLGKEEFDCEKVFERWKDGWKDGRCDL